MQELVPKLRDKPVLVSGRHRCLQVARQYGFLKAVSPAQLAAAHGQRIAPFSQVMTPADVTHSTGHPCPVEVRTLPAG
jgi:hypothetical protein